MAVPFDPHLVLARFQVANMVAPRLLLLALANVLVLVVATTADHRIGRRSALAAQGGVGLAAILVAWSVLNDGWEVLAGFGPPGGQLVQFQATRVLSIGAAALALVAVLAHAAAAAWQGRAGGWLDNAAAAPAK